MTKSVALLGHPLGHSISPVFQQAAFDHYGLDLRYELWETPPEALRETVNRLREESHPGANVTIPHKQSVIPMMDSMDELAANIGAVNTITNSDGKLFGHNTDAPGFLRALREEGDFDPKGKSAVILGAGGAARAVGFALTNAGARFVAITELIAPQKAEELAASLVPLSDTEIITLPWEQDALAEGISHCDLLVNCTPMGMKHGADAEKSPVGAGMIPAGILVYDVVYNPPQTPLLREARLAGAETLGGLSMLVYQGAISFELWTGKRAPGTLMMDTARGALS
jgi:shikimate dehydrogenase